MRLRHPRRWIAALLALWFAGEASGVPRLAGELDAKRLAGAIARERGKVVLVNFWATWCVPCREEFPSLVRLQRAHPGGLRVIGVSTDLAREMPAVGKFLAQQNPNFPNYRKKSGGDDQDFIESVDGSWGGELPFSVLYGRDGRKLKVLSGKQTFADFEREVLKALGQASRAAFPAAFAKPPRTKSPVMERNLLE